MDTSTPSNARRKVEQEDRRKQDRISVKGGKRTQSRSQKATKPSDGKERTRKKRLDENERTGSHSVSQLTKQEQEK
jgi:hypothetical protein